MPTPVSVNDVGDMEITDPTAMLALADPIRLELVDQLTRGGPLSLTELADAIALPQPETAGHLDALAAVGITRTTTDRLWETVGRGIYFQVPEHDPLAQDAARTLSSVMLLSHEKVPRQWVENIEPQLDLPWALAAGLFNAGVTMTASELNAVQEDLEHLLAPYINRVDAPQDARKVRILCYFLPPAPE